MDIHNETDSEIINRVLPLVETMEHGWDIDDYSMFTQSFSESMKNLITEENYTQQRNHIFPILGKHKQLEFLTLHRNIDNVTLIWKMYCEKRDQPILLISSFKTESEKLVISSAIINF